MDWRIFALWGMHTYSPCHANPEQPESTNKLQCRLVILSVDHLCPHPSYVKHQLSVSAPQLATLSGFGDLVFEQPITVTQAGIVVDGYARWELARRQGRQTILCLEYDLSSEEALEALIRAHCPSRGLTDFVRIELALDLEPHFHAKALLNQQAGGKDKVSSKLTIAQRVDTRREVARIAGVSSGNVRKVKNILAHACSSLLQAVRAREVSINLADKWSQLPHAQQQHYLRLRRIERGIKGKARNLVAELVARLSPSTRARHVIRFSDLVGLLNDTGSIEVEIVDVPGTIIFVTKELIQTLTPRQGVLVS